MKHDNRKNYSKNKITVMELFFIFDWLSISAVAFKLGINKTQLERIVSEWKKNDGNIIVESKINN